MKRLHRPLLLAAAVAVCAAIPATAAASAASDAAILAAQQAFHLSPDARGGRLAQAQVDTALASLRAHFREMTPKQQETVRSWFARPTDSTDTDALIRYSEPEAPPYATPQGHFVVHYINDPANVDAPDLTDALDVNGNPVPDGVPDWVEEVGATAETAYSVEVDGLHFNPPPADTVGPLGAPLGPDGKYDIYIVDFDGHNQRGLLGLTTNDLVGADATSYLDVDDDYSATELAGNPFNGLDELKVTVAHEFFHAVQMGYLGVSMPSWLAESSATWMEAQVWPAIPDNFGYLSYLVGPSTEQPYYDTRGLHEYGAWWLIDFFAKHTKARMEFVHKLILRLQSTPANTTTNFEGVAALQKTAGGQHTLSKLFRLYALRQGTKAPFASHIEFHETATQHLGTQLVLPVARISPMQTVYWRVRVPSRHVVVTIQSIANRLIPSDVGLILGGPKGHLAFNTHQTASNFWRIKGTIPIGKPKVVEIVVVHVRGTILPYRLSVASH